MTNHISAFQDILPTICELTSQPIPPNIDGISLLPTLLGKPQREHPYLYWEFPSYGGQQAVRMGKWKGIRKQILDGNKTIELYNLEEDLQEQNDIAANHPTIVAQIEKILIDARVEPTIDRFKMEALGDVKNVYRQAVKRANDLHNVLTKLTVKEGFFTITPQTRIGSTARASKAIKLLQERLETTGGYQLKSFRFGKPDRMIFEQDYSIELASFKMTVTAGKITIAAQDEIGFTNAIQTLLKLMDRKIMIDKEMHRPTWVVAAVEIES